MKYVKKPFLAFAVLGWLVCPQSFAMNSLVRAVEQHTKSQPTKKFSAPKHTTKKSTWGHQYFKKILETPIIAQETTASYPLPKDFLIENWENVLVEPINKRIFHVQRLTKMEKEKFVEEGIKHDDQSENKQYTLLTRGENWAMDRRNRVKDPLSAQHLPICHLRGSYHLNDQHILAYQGSGFRNSHNQIITAGHNIFLDELEIIQYCKKKKLPLPKIISFEKESLILQVFFGYKEEGNITNYSGKIYTVNGKHSFVQKGRDLGIIQLPFEEKEFLDRTVGSLPVKNFPDQPYQYIGKRLTIVGYPGELTHPHLYTHTGHVKTVEPGRIVYYKVDTTGGNSGAPGFPASITEFPGLIDTQKDTRILPVFLTHTHGGDKSNRGEGYDQDFYDFMEKIHQYEAHNQQKNPYFERGTR